MINYKDKCRNVQNKILKYIFYLIICRNINKNMRKLILIQQLSVQLLLKNCKINTGRISIFFKISLRTYYLLYIVYIYIYIYIYILYIYVYIYMYIYIHIYIVYIYMYIVYIYMFLCNILTQECRGAFRGVRLSGELR